MNKTELVDAIAARTSLSKKNVETMLGGMLEVVVETLAGGDKVALVGFGTFEPKARNERSGRNPKTGTPITIPAMTVPTFTPGQPFKDAVNPQSQEPKKGKKAK